MWTVHLSTVYGFMVGFEFISAEDTGEVSGLAIDLGIIRVMILHDATE